MTERTKEDLSPQEMLFCEQYCEIGGDCYSNGTRAAIAAKYSEKSAHTQAWKLLKRPAIREYMQQLWRDNCDKHNITPHKVLSDLEDTRRRAMDKKDFAVVARCVELTGKYLAMWTDMWGTKQQAEEQEQLSDQEKLEAIEYAQWRLLKESRGADDNAAATG